MKESRSFAAKFIQRLIGRRQTRDPVAKLYRRKAYLEAYKAHTDLRVAEDPQAAVGGMWQALGKLQFDFLVESGLKSRCTLLDIGCGTLRGGRHFVAFLDRGRYTGIDISPKAIEYARQLVHDEGLCDKRPRLLVNEDLTFREFEGENFDFLLAQSVFTHLPAENIAECLRHVGAVMGRDSVFHFTFNEAPQVQRTDLKTFSYPFSFFESLAEQSGFHLEDCGDSYKHPRGQRMARLWRAAAGRPG